MDLVLANDALILGAHGLVWRGSSNTSVFRIQCSIQRSYLFTKRAICAPSENCQSLIIKTNKEAIIEAHAQLECIVQSGNLRVPVIAGFIA